MDQLDIMTSTESEWIPETTDFGFANVLLERDPRGASSTPSAQSRARATPRWESVSSLDDVRFQSYVRTMQRIVLFETKTRYYVVGSNEQENRFRILKIDRTEPKNLTLLPEAEAGSVREIQAILSTIEGANAGSSSAATSGQQQQQQEDQKGLKKVLSAYGIAGFVRFLEGHYAVFVVRRLKCAMVGFHPVYKIEETRTVYLPNSDSRQAHPDEARYARMFSGMDMSANFYYSYSYDLTNTLQHNLATPRRVMGKDGKWREISDLFPPGGFPSEMSYVGRPNERFMWNSFLLEPVSGGGGGEDGESEEDGDEEREPLVSHEWILPIIHGFVQQNNLSIFGRSNKYAGTRFLKRGANEQGDVANEVETEQIVTESSVSSLHSSTRSALGPGRATSFVQMRGSVPGLWGQDITKMMPKPQIFYRSRDAYCSVSGRHFNQLHEKYGSPVHVVNLVKRKEKFRVRHEALLAEMLEYMVRNLNLFLADHEKIKYSRLDMAKAKKSRDRDVMRDLGVIAEASLRATGIFCNFVPNLEPVAKTSRHHRLAQSLQDRVSSLSPGAQKLLQTGIARTNCVDCLDRTNTAQYVIAKCALALQLYSLSLLPEPWMDPQCDCARMLEKMYEDHGDTLAMQYGGSQLVHRIKSYRKESSSAWTNKANDITQNLRRYYSNTLSDAEKQNTINLFLGVYRPSREKEPIWSRNFTTDEYLHNPNKCKPYKAEMSLRATGDKWWNPSLRSCLPFPLLEREKGAELLVLHPRRGCASEALFREQYRTFEYTNAREAFEFRDVLHSVRDITPYGCLEFSPFAHREDTPKFREVASAMSGGVLSRLASYMPFKKTKSPQKGSGGAKGKKKDGKDAFSSDKKDKGARSPPRILRGAGGSASSDSEDDTDEDDDDGEERDVLASELGDKGWTILDAQGVATELAADAGASVALVNEARPVDASVEGDDFLEPVDYSSDCSDDEADKKAKEAAAPKEEPMRPKTFEELCRLTDCEPISLEPASSDVDVEAKKREVLQSHVVNFPVDPARIPLYEHLDLFRLQAALPPAIEDASFFETPERVKEEFRRYVSPLDVDPASLFETSRTRMEELEKYCNSQLV